MPKGIYERTPEMIENMGKAQTERYKDPEEHRKSSEAQIKAGSGKYERTPKTIEKLSGSLVDYHKGLTLEEKSKLGTGKYKRTPDMMTGRYKRTLEILETMKDNGKFKRTPAMNEAMSEACTKGGSGKFERTPEMNLGNFKRTPEHCENISKTAKERFKNPEECKRMSKQATEQWESPGYYEAHSGENVSYWKGGDRYYGPYWKDMKWIIPERDGYVCQLCRTKKRLCPHHIDYDKDNWDPDDLITLCGSCNSHVNSNRDYWTFLFRTMMELKKMDVAYVAEEVK